MTGYQHRNRDCGQVEADWVDATERGLVRPEDGVTAESGCGCTVTVAWWTGVQTRALRMAIRLSVRGFAEYLGVTDATVSNWERSKRPTTPSPAMQSVLDRALKIADVDVRSRFHQLLHPVQAEVDRRPARQGAGARDGGLAVATPQVEVAGIAGAARHSDGAPATGRVNGHPTIASVKEPRR